MRRDQLLELKVEIMDMADVFAAAVVRNLSPPSDEITRRKAVKEFGGAWLKEQEDKDRIKGCRKGKSTNSPVMYSRTELLALREAQRQAVKITHKGLTKNRAI